MRKLWLFFILFLLPVFAQARSGTITSPYSIDYDNGDGSHTLVIYAGPKWVQDENSGEWKDFSDDVPVIANSSGLFINFSNGVQRRLAFFPKLPAACDDYTLVRAEAAGWEFSSNCNVPQGHGSFVKNFSGAIAQKFVGNSGFQTRRFYFSFDNWNINSPEFNSSIVFTNFSDGNLQVNLSWSSNQSQTIALDPFISAGVSDDVSLYQTTDVSQGQTSYVKFNTPLVLPAGANITSALLALNHFQNLGFSPPASLNLTVWNMTGDWNSTDNGTQINNTPFNYTLNYSVPTRNVFSWTTWNVTNAVSYFYNANINSSFKIGIGQASGNLDVVVNNFRLCFGNTAGPIANAYCYNSSESIGAFPQLNITYISSTAPQWSNNRTNGSASGQPTLFLVNWTDNLGLSNYTFEFDNGSGVFVNQSPAFFTGTANTSNASLVINFTVGSTIRWRVYAWDTSGEMNVTTIFSLTTTGGQSFVTCPDGAYIANQTGMYRFLSNGTGLLTGTARILDENGSVVTNYSTMTSNTTDSQLWFNYTINLSKPGTYWIGVNISNGWKGSEEIVVKSLCSANTFVVTGALDLAVNAIDWGIIPYLTLFALSLAIFALYRRSPILMLGLGIVLISTGFLIYADTPNLGISQITSTNTTTAFAYLSSGALANTTTVTTPTLVALQNSTTYGVGFALVAAGLGIGIFAAYKMFFGKMEV